MSTYSSIKDDSNTDYYENYDYDTSTLNRPDNINKVATDTLIMPNPDSMESKYMVDSLPEINLPDDSLADTDLKDHDLIDNLMYVYYGSNSSNDNVLFGDTLIKLGAGIALLANATTIMYLLLRKQKGVKVEILQMFVNLIMCMLLANVIFLTGIRRIEDQSKCMVIGLTLNYLHLAVSCWLFTYCLYLFRQCSANSDVKSSRYYLGSYLIPCFICLISYEADSRSFATDTFCFISIEKGMALNYMIPISGLMILTTIVSVSGVKEINSHLSKLEANVSLESLLRIEAADKTTGRTISELKAFRSCFKLLCVTQTSYGVVWFASIIALENVSYSNVMPFAYMLTSALLHWYVFLNTKVFLPIHIFGWHISNGCDDVELNTSNSDKEERLQQPPSDKVPLLLGSESYNSEMIDQYPETISTISS